MRIFDNTTEAYPEILRDIVKFGRTAFSKTVQNLKDVSPEEYSMKELQLYSFCILDDSDRRNTCKDLEWLMLEFRERVFESNNPNPGEAYIVRKEYWNKFLTDGKFCYTYGERMKPSLHKAIMLLMGNPETRQAIISVWDREIDTQNTGGIKRVPCTMYYNVQIREGKVDIIYHMRSSDFFEHFRNDLTLAGELKHFVSKSIGVPPGKTFMSVDSLHAYKKDWETLGIY